jgi:ATP-binding protein involved in chromosome partitioning
MSDNQLAIPGVRKIIAVASGKGGVGKSTTAVNLALALSAEGQKVGLLDADIYGPSLPTMLGVPTDQRPDVVDGKRLAPIMAHGLQTLSMGNLTTADTPMVWRGPMASSALQQIIGQTLWHDLDLLVVDMPPGTGDIQLTLSQKVPLDGAVIVTTPQDIALMDAVKGVEMFNKVNVPVLGIVENMAMHICSSCGHQEYIFGAGGGQSMAEKYDVDLLGSLPLDVRIREDLDDGLPTMVKSPEGDIAQLYREIAKNVLASLAKQGDAPKMPEITIE